MMTDDYYRSEIREGRAMLRHADAEIRRRNRLRVWGAIRALKRRRAARGQGGAT